MPHCAVIWCCNQSKNVNKHNSGVTYHKFPNDPQVKSKWILATGKCDWSPGKHDTICSVHFEDETFLQRNPCTQLCADAFPTLKLHPYFTENYSSRQSDNAQSTESENKTTIKIEKIEEESVIEPVVEIFQDNGSVEQSSPTSRRTDTKSKYPEYVQLTIEDTSQMRKIKLNLMKAQDTIKRQRFQIRQLRDTNKKLTDKVAEMEVVINNLHGKPAATDKDTNVKSKCLNIKFKRKDIDSH